MNMPTVAFQKEAFSNLEETIAKEWLITNGMGGYASSTIPGINTRKYHGLLVAALHPPADRTVCVSKLDEDVIVDDETYRLGSNQFLDTVYPQGYRLISQFSVSPYPRYIYELDNIRISKTIFMPKNKNAITLIYQALNKSASDVIIKLFPLLTCRHFHTVIDRSKNPLTFTTESESREFKIDFLHPQASLICSSTDGKFKETQNMIDRLFYCDDWLRGESYLDDCFQPGFFELQVNSQTQKEFAVNAAVYQDTAVANENLSSLGGSIAEINASFNQALTEKRNLLSEFYHLSQKLLKSNWLKWILIAADSFVVQSLTKRKAVVAGYHWFESWGRDAFISLPGLMLVTGRFCDAKNIFQTYMQYSKDGLIPNYFEDKTENPVYNTVDATLWYFNAIYQYLKYTGDFEFVRVALWDNLKSIIENHQKGTLFNILMNKDGLLSHGPGLTWMDAKVGFKEVTPRKGMAVEIQALWYNTLRIMELLANKFGEKDLAIKYGLTADETRRSFNDKFWDSKKACLFDVVDSNGVDSSLRPNQILAVSLDFSMLDHARSLRVVEVVTNELATWCGLRTLSIDDPKFVGKYKGDRSSRDTAYHNGTIWPWLLGPHVTAYVKVNDYTRVARNFALKNYILPLFKIGLKHGGMGTINEIYDCDPPNEPRGCISQAWSIAEPFRAYVEDVLQIKPRNAEKFYSITS